MPQNDLADVPPTHTHRPGLDSIRRPVHTLALSQHVMRLIPIVRSKVRMRTDTPPVLTYVLYALCVPVLYALHAFGRSLTSVS